MRSNWIISNHLVLRHKSNVDSALHTRNYNELIVIQDFDNKMNSIRSNHAMFI